MSVTEQALRYTRTHLHENISYTNSGLHVQFQKHITIQMHIRKNINSWCPDIFLPRLFSLKGKENDRLDLCSTFSHYLSLQAIGMGCFTSYLKKAQKLSSVTHRSQSDRLRRLVIQEDSWNKWNSWIYSLFYESFPLLKVTPVSCQSHSLETSLAELSQTILSSPHPIV